MWQIPSSQHLRTEAPAQAALRKHRIRQTQDIILPSPVCAKPHHGPRRIAPAAQTSRLMNGLDLSQKAIPR